MFYEKFLDLCVNAGKSPTSICKQMGISATSLSYWRSGRVPHDSTVRKICRYFSVPLSYFDEDADPQPEEPTADQRLDALLDELRNDPARRMLFELLAGATEDEVREAVAIIDALKRCRRG